MPAAITDKLTYVGEPGSATYLASPGYTMGGTGMTLETWSGWPTGTVHFDVYTIELDGTKEKAKANTRTYWKAIHNGSGGLSSLTLKGGTYQNYAAGTSTRVIITHSAYRENEIIDVLTNTHDQDGTLKAGAVDVAAVLANNVVTTSAILDKNVTLAKVNGGSTAGVLTTDASGNVTSTTNIWGEELGRATVSADFTGALNLTVTLDAAHQRKYYQVIGVVDRSGTPTGNIYAQIVVNGDTGSNYKNIGTIVDNSTTVTGQSSTITNIAEVKTAEFITGIMEVTVAKVNSSDYPTFSNKCGSSIYNKQTSGWWQNTGTITSFSMTSPSTGWKAGTELVVRGHN